LHVRVGAKETGGGDGVCVVAHVVGFECGKDSGFVVCFKFANATQQKPQQPT